MKLLCLCQEQDGRLEIFLFLFYYFFIAYVTTIPSITFENELSPPCYKFLIADRFKCFQITQSTSIEYLLKSLQNAFYKCSIDSKNQGQLGNQKFLLLFDLFWRFSQICVIHCIIMIMSTKHFLTVLIILN